MDRTFAFRRQQTEQLITNAISHIQPEAGNEYPRRGGNSGAEGQYTIVSVTSTMSADFDGTERAIVKIGDYVEKDNFDEGWFFERTIFNATLTQEPGGVYPGNTIALPTGVLLDPSEFNGENIAVIAGAIECKLKLLSDGNFGRYAQPAVDIAEYMETTHTPTDIKVIWAETGDPDAVVWGSVIIGSGSGDAVYGGVAKVLTGGIGAISGTFPGQGDCDRQTLNFDNPASPFLETAGEDMFTVYNTTGATFLEDAIIQYKVDVDGYFWVDVKDCN